MPQRSVPLGLASLISAGLAPNTSAIFALTSPIVALRSIFSACFCSSSPMFVKKTVASSSLLRFTQVSN
eukprot:SAG11_NODE_305_length_10996_cov_4.698082_10_plen_69_part_00